MHPAFPPSLIDFFVRGQQTSLPGYREIGVPADIEFALDAADQDAEAERNDARAGPRAQRDAAHSAGAERASRAAAAERQRDAPPWP